MFSSSFWSSPAQTNLSIDSGPGGSSLTGSGTVSKSDDKAVVTGGAGYTLFNDGYSAGSTKTLFVGASTKDGGTQRSVTVHACRTDAPSVPAPVDEIGVRASTTNGTTSVSGGVKGQHCWGYTRAEADVAVRHEVSPGFSVEGGASKGTDTPARSFFGISLSF